MSAVRQNAGSERSRQPARPAAGLRVGIIGGGIAGLASAHFLVEAGHTPIVFEGNAQLGGLGTHFVHEDVAVERFYHVILDSDADLRSLLAAFSMSDRIVWAQTGMGFMVDRALHAFNTPADVLRFRALPVADRLRVGLAALYITRLKRHARDLDDIPARDWLVRLFGPRVFARIWDPLLRAKFGDLRHGVPAYWVWNTLNREKNGRQEVKGYVRGGYRAIVEALAKTVCDGGGEVRTSVSVERIQSTATGLQLEAHGRPEHFDAVVSTLPLPLLSRIASDSLRTALPLSTLQYQGVVNVLVISRARLSRFYWTAVVDPSFPFQGVVETTNVIPTAWTGGRHLVYVMNYCGADSEPYQRPDPVLKRQAVEGLATLYPHFDPANVEAVYVFRTPHVEPVWTLGYLRARPAPRVGGTRLYLCTTAQAYPRVTAWNTSVALARETVATLNADLAEPQAAVAA